MTAVMSSVISLACLATYRNSVPNVSKCTQTGTCQLGTSKKACQVVIVKRVTKCRNTIYGGKLMQLMYLLMSRYTEFDTLSESFIHRSQLSFMSLSTACKAGSFASPIWRKLTKRMTCDCFCLRYKPLEKSSLLIQHAKSCKDA